MSDETVRPEDLKPGDRVRIAVDVVVASADSVGEIEVEYIDGGFGGYIGPNGLAHATITRLSPPVDPDLLLARRLCAEMWPSMAAEYERGACDDGKFCSLALAAINLAKERS